MYKNYLLLLVVGIIIYIKGFVMKITCAAGRGIIVKNEEEIFTPHFSTAYPP